MKIYDISQEVFGAEVYPGDPSPKWERVFEIGREQSLCNVTKFSMCAHNGTHLDAPYHFFNEGKTIDEISLKQVVGEVFVVTLEGEIGKEQALTVIETAKRQAGQEASRRILIRGRAAVTMEAAKVFAREKILLLGNESQTVGVEEQTEEIHTLLLGEGIVLLEGVRLAEVKDGRYFLNAAPLNLGGADGAPCRAILIKQ